MHGVCFIVCLADGIEAVKWCQFDVLPALNLIVASMRSYKRADRHTKTTHRTIDMKKYLRSANGPTVVVNLLKKHIN